MTRTISNFLGILGLIILCLLSRLIFFTPYLEDWDGIDFCLALRHYDLSAYQPHFPGYPIYVAVGRLMYYFIPSEVSALILVNILFSSLTLLPLMALTRSIFSRNGAFMAGLLYLVNPLCWLEGEKVLADPTGLFFITAALYFLARASSGISKYPLLLGGLCLGLSCGVRLDYFSFFVLLVYASSQRRYGYSFLGYLSFFLGVAIWLLPQLSIGGWSDFWIEAKKFIIGHFSTWGGSIYSQPSLPTRLKSFFWSFYANGLGGWWPDTSRYRLLTSVILFGETVYFLYYFPKGRWIRDYKKKLILLGLILYCLWIFLGQNLANPRHVLPAMPLTIILLVGTWQGCQMKPKGSKIATLPFFCLLGLIGLWTIEGIRLNLIHNAQLPPQLQAVQYIKDYFPEHSARIYCQETKRLFDYYAPYYQVKRVRNYDYLEQDLLGTYPQMSPILFVTPLIRKELNSMNVDLMKVFPNNRYVYYPGHTWYLYRLRPIWNEPG